MATTVSRDDIIHLAKLSNLKLEDYEIDVYQKDLEQILSYVSKLDELNTDAVEPRYQVGDLENVWRDDQVQEHEVGRKELLQLSPDSMDNQIKVPKVL